MLLRVPVLLQGDSTICVAAGAGKVCMFEGLFGLIVLVLDIWAIFNVFQSSDSTGSKVLWTLLILVLPVLGLIIWYFAGPKKT